MTNLELCVYEKMRAVNDNDTMTAIDFMEFAIDSLKDAIKAIETINKNKNNPYFVDSNGFDIYMSIAKSNLDMAMRDIKIAKM